MYNLRDGFELAASTLPLIFPSVCLQQRRPEWLGKEPSWCKQQKIWQKAFSKNAAEAGLSLFQANYVQL